MNVVSVRYRPIRENKQQDKMTAARIFIQTTHDQFKRCVNKSYRKWLCMLSPGCADRFSKGGDLELLNGSPVTSGCGVGALLQPGASPSYGADGKGLPGWSVSLVVLGRSLQGVNGSSL